MFVGSTKPRPNPKLLEYQNTERLPGFSQFRDSEDWLYKVGRVSVNNDPWPSWLLGSYEA